jgi:hypothetical protein
MSDVSLGSSGAAATANHREWPVFISHAMYLQEKGITELLQAPGKLADKIAGMSGTRNLGDNLSDLRAQVQSCAVGSPRIRCMWPFLTNLHNTGCWSIIPVHLVAGGRQQPGDSAGGRADPGVRPGCGARLHGLHPGVHADSKLQSIWQVGLNRSAALLL